MRQRKRRKVRRESQRKSREEDAEEWEERKWKKAPIKYIWINTADDLHTINILTFILYGAANILITDHIREANVGTLIHVISVTSSCTFPVAKTWELQYGICCSCSCYMFAFPYQSGKTTLKSRWRHGIACTYSCHGVARPVCSRLWEETALSGVQDWLLKFSRK